MNWILFFCLSLSSFALFAQEASTQFVAPVETPTETKKETKEIIPVILYSADLRENSNHSVMLGYQVLTTWIPFKWALGYTYNFSRKWSVELEWSRGSYGIGAFGFDAARITENRYSILGRRYIGNSFNFILGGFKNDFYGELGDRILKEMTDTSIDDFRVQGMGLTMGIGNRWQWENGFTLGIDWMRMNLPLFNKKVDNGVLDNIDDSNDLSTVKDSIQKVKNLPTFVLLGLHMGYSF